MGAFLAFILFVPFAHLSDATPLRPVAAQAVVRLPLDGTPLAVRFPRASRDYRIDLIEDHRVVPLASGSTVPLEGITLPSALAGTTVRLSAVFIDDQPARIAPAEDLRREFLRLTIALTAFFGFFFAIAVVNVISSMVLRSIPSAWYALLATTVATIMLFSIGTLRPLYGADITMEQILHAALIALYLCSVAGFGISLLGSLKSDRRAARIVLALCALNVLLVFCEDVFGQAWRYYLLDQLALDVLLIALAVLGIRAMHRGNAPFAKSYLIAFAGPLAGVPINDLAMHNLLSSELAKYSFEFGITWEAIFFAYAVAVRNRALSRERDWFNKLAHADALTGVANRRTMDEVLAQQWQTSAKARAPLGLLMIDIDNFKQYNDTYGHRSGDELLRVVARTCEAVITRSGDCFARYGGEEFVGILPGATIDGVTTVAERMRTAIAAETPVTISIGCASFVPYGDDPGLLVVAADAALYRTKEDGRNCVRSA